MTADIFTYTNVGSRTHNEDYFEVKNGQNGAIAVLCDGLGGHNCGEVASKMAADSIVEGISGIESLTPENIFKVLRSTNQMLIDAQIKNPEYQGMRTTAVGCILDGTKIHYYNVGDSRFYLFRNGSLKTMTKDHSVSAMSVALGEKSFEDIRFDVDRNKLLKVLGEPINGEVGTVYRSEIYYPGDAFLLCSDGFWEYVLEDEMIVDLSKSNTCEEWIKYMLVRLILRMNGNNDNFSVVGGIIR